MILQIIRRIINWLGPKTILYFCLQIIGIGSVAYGLANIVQGLQADFAVGLVFLAVLMSWCLAKIRMNAWVGAFLLLITGLGLLFMMTGDLWEPVFTFLNTVTKYLWDLIYHQPDQSIDTSSLNLAYSEVSVAIRNTMGAYRDWILSIREGIPIYDEIAISFVWGFAIWFVAGWAGWVLRRNKSPLISFLPSGILLSVSSSYSWAGIGAFPPLIISTLLLLALDNFDNSEKFWQDEKMDYPEGLSREFSLITIVMVAGIVLLAYLLPNFSIKSIMEYAQKFTAPRIQDAEPVIHSFGLNQNPGSKDGVNRAIKGGYPRSHLLGSGPELEENVIMSVRLIGSVDRSDGIMTEFPLYWRALTYDDYYGPGWRSSDIVMRSYDAGEEILKVEPNHHEIILLDFRISDGENNFLYSPGEIFTADDDFSVAYRPTIRYTEVFNAHGDFFGGSINKSRYRVQSVIPVITGVDLRTKTSDYPQWIRERYLNLPDVLSARVIKLAEDLTVNSLNPYDKVKIIEQYLRTFDYSLDLEVPSDKRDLVDYFLFDLQQGYCDYFATAMVVMSRSVGVPARLAIGYYKGSYDEVNDRYIVTEADAHSWVEVYFPEIGWVPFEPTPGREEINYLVAPIDGEIRTENAREFIPFKFWLNIFQIKGANSYWIFLTFLPVLLLLAYFIDNIRLRIMHPSKTIIKIYQRLFNLGKRVKAGAERDTTPWQFSQGLIYQIEFIIQRGYFKRFLISSLEDIKVITNIYTQTIYSPWRPDKETQKQTIAIWERIRTRLWLTFILLSVIQDKGMNLE